MEEQKNQIKLFREKIESFRSYSDEIAKDYIIVLKEITAYIEDLKYDENNKRLNMRIKDGLRNLKIELRDRFDNHYFTMRDKKKADEFRFSKHIVLNSLKRIIRNL